MRVVWDGTHTHSDDTAVPVADDWVLPLAYVDHVGVLRNEATVAAVFSCSLGAAQEAVASGVPVLCLPSLPVHREVADRLARLGVAAALDPAEATAWDVHRSLDALVEGASCVRCARGRVPARGAHCLIVRVCVSLSPPLCLLLQHVCELGTGPHPV